MIVVVAATVVNGSSRSVAAAVVNGSYGSVAATVVNRCGGVTSAVVTVHTVLALHIALTGSVVHLITSVIIHNVLLSMKLHRKVRLHVYSMNNCGIGAYNWGRENRERLNEKGTHKSECLHCPYGENTS